MRTFIGCSGNGINKETAASHWHWSEKYWEFCAPRTADAWLVLAILWLFNMRSGSSGGRNLAVKQGLLHLGPDFIGLHFPVWRGQVMIDINLSERIAPSIGIREAVKPLTPAHIQISARVLPKNGYQAGPYVMLLMHGSTEPAHNVFSHKLEARHCRYCCVTGCNFPLQWGPGTDRQSKMTF